MVLHRGEARIRSEQNRFGFTRVWCYKGVARLGLTVVDSSRGDARRFDTPFTAIPEPSVCLLID
jgi:hypothetical protein